MISSSNWPIYAGAAILALWLLLRWLLSRRQ